MPNPQISGFSIVRNASILDFPIEASIASVLPGVDEFVVAVGRSDDDTLARIRAISDPRIRIIESEWDLSLKAGVLAAETDRAMAACHHPWGIYIQADEVLEDEGAQRLREQIVAAHGQPLVEGLLVDFVHFYGGFDSVGVSRRWYRREVRAVRLGGAVRSHRDAQGFRVGPNFRRIRARKSGVRMHHYGPARPAWALQAKREQDRLIYPTELLKDPARPLLTWSPGLQRFSGSHPAVAAAWIAARAAERPYVGPRTFRWGHLRIWVSLALERLIGWRPFEFRNYTVLP